MRKLRNEKGVTILMALLLVLVATVVSAVILSAAVSAVHRVKSDRNAQQDYLAVSSAAELIRESILQDKSYEKTVVTVTRMDENGDPLEPDPPSTSETLPTGLMSAWLTAGARSDGCSDDISLEISGGEADGVFKPVRAQFTMDSDYNITIVLSLADAAADHTADDCRMTLTLNGKSETSRVVSNEETKRTTIVKTTISWDNPRIVKGTEGA